MRKIAFLLASLFAVCVSMTAQELSQKTQGLVDACNAMRTAIGSGSLPALRKASKSFTDCKASPFGVLKCLDKEPLSLDGHFVFDSEFADSLVAGRQVYAFAQKYADRSRQRAKRGSGALFYATYAVKAASSAHFSFTSRGHQELAVITEPEGLITLRIHDTKHDMWYNDTEDVTAGRPSRVLVFDLPTNEISTLELDVINTGTNDTSFVVISN